MFVADNTLIFQINVLPSEKFWKVLSQNMPLREARCPENQLIDLQTLFKFLVFQILR